jgi:hypothetical protein
VKSFRGKLCSGTLYATAAEHLLEFNGNSPEFKDILDL